MLSGNSGYMILCVKMVDGGSGEFMLELLKYGNT